MFKNKINSADQEIRITRKTSFTTIPRNIIRGLRYNPTLLGLYTILMDFPPTWNFRKSHLRGEMGGMGIHTLNKLLKCLENHGLIKLKQVRDSKGRFSFFDLEIDDEFEFIPLDSPCYENRNTVAVLRLDAPSKALLDKPNKKIKSPPSVDKLQDRESFTFTHEEMKEAIDRDIIIQLCFQKFLDFIKKPKFKRGAWEKWFANENDGKKSKFNLKNQTESDHFKAKMKEHIAYKTGIYDA